MLARQRRRLVPPPLARRRGTIVCARRRGRTSAPRASPSGRRARRGGRRAAPPSRERPRGPADGPSPRLARRLRGGRAARWRSLGTRRAGLTGGRACAPKRNPKAIASPVLDFAPRRPRACAWARGFLGGPAFAVVLACASELAQVSHEARAGGPRTQIKAALGTGESERQSSYDFGSQATKCRRCLTLVG